jgi:hypothetical protein
VSLHSTFYSGHRLHLTQLNKGQHTAYGTLVGIIDNRRRAKLTLALAAFLGKDVATMRLTALEATIGCTAKPLGGAAIGFHLRHVYSPASLGGQII